MDSKFLSIAAKVGAVVLGVVVFSIAIVTYIVPRHTDRAASGFPCLDSSMCLPGEVCSQGVCVAGNGTCVAGQSCTVSGAFGTCSQGTTSCDPSGATVCIQTNLPQPEMCNNIDDDCDGVIDNGTTGIPCTTGLPGTCDAGMTVCQGGKGVCVPSDPSCSSVCGDGMCNGSETPASCSDCFVLYCHDKCTVGYPMIDPGACNDSCVGQVCAQDSFCCEPSGQWDETCIGEAISICGITCTAPPPVCGDNMCGANEATTCPQDCIFKICGDGICDKAESPQTCPLDCSGSFCGDGVCDPNETFANCSLDCSCKDNADCAAPTPVCDATNKQCVQCLANSDCGIGAQCQNGTCNAVTPCTCQSVVESITTWKNAGMKKAALKQCAQLVTLDASNKNTGKACNAKCNALSAISRKLPAADRKKIQDFCGMVTAQVKNNMLCVANPSSCTK